MYKLVSLGVSKIISQTPPSAPFCFTRLGSARRVPGVRRGEPERLTFVRRGFTHNATSRRAARHLSAAVDSAVSFVVRWAALPATTCVWRRPCSAPHHDASATGWAGTGTQTDRQTNSQWVDVHITAGPTHQRDGGMARRTAVQVYT